MCEKLAPVVRDAFSWAPGHAAAPPEPSSTSKNRPSARAESRFSHLTGGKGLLKELLCGEFEIVAAVHPCVAAARIVEGVFYLIDGEVFVKSL